MYAIYQKASRVIVWLGLSSRNAQLAAEWLKAVALDWPDRLLPSNYSEFTGGKHANKLWDPPWNSSIFIMDRRQYQSNLRRDILQGLEEIAQCAWIRRIWIVQEVHAARSVTVSCASVSLIWKAFSYLEQGLEVIEDVGRWHDDHAPAHYRRGSMEKGIEMLEAINAVALSRFPPSLTSGISLSSVEPHVRLLELTEYFQNSEATIPHDKIYALLTMASVKVKPASNRPTVDNEIEVDYRISLPDLFRRVTAYLILNFASLDLLLSNRRLTSAQSASWARDFRVSGLQDVNYFTLFREERETTPHLSFEGSSLRTKGHILGAIHKTMDVLLVKEVGSPHLCQRSDLRHVEVTELTYTKRDLKEVHFEDIISSIEPQKSIEAGPQPKYMDAGTTIWIATGGAHVGDKIAKLHGSACPVVLREISHDKYHYVGGIRPLIAGQIPVSGTQKGAIRVGFESGEGYYDIRRDLPWSEWELKDIRIV